ncbi:MAG: acyl-CoA dehydrogenase family protein, partial [Gammaproteobacteria bacterium]|nr:acyl-CoA dehydrogenase family protein [Gammaproteobacteria bacterium]
MVGAGWFAFIALAIILNIDTLRTSLVTDRLLDVFRKILPPMSQTEQEALAAGTVWWDAQLFSGNPQWNDLLEYPVAKLTDEEQAFVDGPVNELCAMLNDWKINQELNDLPPEVWQFIKDNKFFGMIIPKEFGGLEFSALAHSAVVMKISTRSVAAAVTVMVPNSLGPAELLLRYGTDEQKQHYLPRLAVGKDIPCFALTSPEAGSDASSIPDTGIVCRGEYNGKKD